MVKYRPSVLHSYGWIPGLIWRNFKARAFALRRSPHFLASQGTVLADPYTLFQARRACVCRASWAERVPPLSTLLGSTPPPRQVMTLTVWVAFIEATADFWTDDNDVQTLIKARGRGAGLQAPAHALSLSLPPKPVPPPSPLPPVSREGRSPPPSFLPRPAHALSLCLPSPRWFPQFFGTPYLGAVLNLCMLVTFILGLFVTLVVNRWRAGERRRARRRMYSTESRSPPSSRPPSRPPVPGGRCACSTAWRGRCPLR